MQGDQREHVRNIEAKYGPEFDSTRPRVGYQRGDAGSHGDGGEEHYLGDGA